MSKPPALITDLRGACNFDISLTSFGTDKSFRTAAVGKNEFWGSFVLLKGYYDIFFFSLWGL
jgi:hypothetical protein